MELPEARTTDLPHDPVVASVLQRMGLIPGPLLQQSNDAQAATVDDLEIEALGSDQRQAVFSVVADMVDPVLKAAVKQHGLMPMLATFAAGRNLPGLGCQAFLDLWERPAEEEWLKEKFRDLRPAHHEWIPTSLMRPVFERARQDLRWLSVHDKLRSPTGDVIFAWSKAPEAISQDGKTYTILNGHVGAIYYLHEQQVCNQQAFHQELRAVFQAESGIPACLKALQAVARNWLWDGQMLLHPLHPALCETRDKPFDIKRLMENRASVYANTIALFDSDFTFPKY